MLLGMSIAHYETITLPDGRNFTKKELLLEAVEHMGAWEQMGTHRGISEVYNELGCLLRTGEKISLFDGRTANSKELFIEALHLELYRGSLTPVLYYNLCCELDPAETVQLANGQVLHCHELLLEALRSDPNDSDCLGMLGSVAPPGLGWTRATHALLFRGKTNVLFATLLLGLQRLEAMGLLPLAHYSMLEDMLEGWTWGDVRRTE